LEDRPCGARVARLVDHDTRRPEAEVLVVTSLDRLTRDAADGMRLIEALLPNGRRNPVRLVSLDDHLDLAGATGRLFARVKVLFSSYELEIGKERTSRALQHKRRTGRAYSREPYGWDVADGRLVPNEEEQSVI